MALVKSFDAEHGETYGSAYARVTGLALDYVAEVGTIHVAIYKDEAARRGGFRPLSLGSFPLSKDGSPEVAPQTEISETLPDGSKKIHRFAKAGRPAARKFADVFAGSNQEARVAAYAYLKEQPEFSGATDA